MVNGCVPRCTEPSPAKSAPFEQSPLARVSVCPSEIIDHGKSWLGQGGERGSNPEREGARGGRRKRERLREGETEEEDGRDEALLATVARENV